MKAQRTPWWYFVTAMILGLALGAAIAYYGEDVAGVSLLGAPWIVLVLLMVLGIVILIMALQVHKYATTDPRKRSTVVDPMKAVYTLVLSKALGLAGAALAGWYGGQILVVLAHAEAPYYSKVLVECVVAAVICLADMIIGIIGEWLCQLPPDEGAENPKMRAMQRRRGVSPAATRESSH